MRILVVCAQGASSTFVALRLRRAAEAARIACTVTPATVAELPARLADADVILIGPPLASRAAELVRVAAAGGVPAVLLPPESVADRDGGAALHAALAARSAAPPSDPEETQR